MPVILLERLPIPSLRTYTVFSAVLLSCAVYYAHLHSAQQEIPDNEENSESAGDPIRSYTYVHDRKFLPIDSIDELNLSEPFFSAVVRNGTDLAEESYGLKMATILLGETWCIWSLVNTACCCLILLGYGIQKIVFGPLRVSEHQHLRDKFWNFAFYKFIFIFGVMNVQSMEEVVLWCTWFGVLASLHLLAQLCKDRFEYLSFSPATPMRTHIKVLLLLVGIQMTCIALFAVCIPIGYMFVGPNIFAFMAAEVILLMTKTVYVVVRYAIHLWDLHCDRVWENRSMYTYYAELVFELVAISTDFCNHLHMLVWSNIFLSMASLVICMQLRYLFHELQRRIRRHKNYLRVVNTMDEKFSMATPAELEHNDDDCAICWENMESARRLPCGHLFHNACLRSWLEQDTSCPICRDSLTDLQPGSAPPRGPQQGAGDAPPVPDLLQRQAINLNHLTNHFFHFDGSRYVSWLPSFSVEVTHTQLLGNRLRAHQQQTSLLDNMARQVQEVFPNMPLGTILSDLSITHSVEITIENIVEGRLQAPPAPTFPRSSPHDSESASGSDSDGNGSEPSMNQEESRAADSPDSNTQDPGLVDPTSVSGGLYDPLPTVTPASSLNFCDEGLQSASSPPEDMNHHMRQEEFAAMTGGRFSKSPQEREDMLHKRKESMLEHARRKYMSKQHQEQGNIHIYGSSVPENHGGESSSNPFSDRRVGSGRSAAQSDVHQRRERAFLAAQRRLRRD